jgi:WD40 repeat protein
VVTAFSPDGTTLAIAGNGGIGSKGSTQLWDVPAGKLIRTLPDDASAVAFSPDGKILAIGVTGGTQLWDLPAGKLIKVLPAAAGRTVFALAFSPSGTHLAAAVDDQIQLDGQIQLWDIPAGQLIKTLTSANLSVGSLAFSPDGAFLAAADEVTRGQASAETQLWQVAAGRLVRTLPVFGQTTVSPVSAVAFSPDGETLAVGISDGTQLWNAVHGVVGSWGTQAPVILPTGQTAAPLAFAPGTDALAVSTPSGIQLWDTATGQQFASRPVRGASQTPQVVAVSTAGTLATIAVNGQDHQVQLWPMPYLTHPAAALCALAGVPFNKDTWAAEAQGIPYQPTCP